MNQIFDSIVIALQAIWANKLRSFMTVLGNIVAVTSIVTVVTLIQGMNGMVADALMSGIGADSFTIQRRPPIFNEDDEERARNNPMITIEEADAIRAFSPIIASVAAQANRSASVSYRTEEVENAQIQGVTSSYIDFSTFSVEIGRMMSPVEVERSQTRLGACGSAVRRHQSAGQDHQDRRHQLPRRRRKRAEGFVLRKLAGQLRGDSARGVSTAVRRPAVSSADGEAGDDGGHAQRHG
jgi:hypothetical protein